jgi:hypothetical protein
VRIIDYRDGPNDIDELIENIVEDTNASGVAARGDSVRGDTNVAAATPAILLLQRRDRPSGTERVFDAVCRRLRARGCPAIPAATIHGSGVYDTLEYFKHIRDTRHWSVFHFESPQSSRSNRVLREIGFRRLARPGHIFVVDAPLVVPCELEGEWIEWQA